MGIFSSIGGLLDDKPSKQFKKARTDTANILFGEGGVPTGPLNLTAGTATNPFGTATYGPGGAVTTLSPQFQNLFNRGLGQANRFQDIFDVQVPNANFFESSPFMTNVLRGVEGDVRDINRAAENALSAQFNTGGIGTASLNQQADIINQLRDAEFTRRAQAQRQGQDFLAGLQGLRGRDLDYLGTLGGLANTNLQTARALSGDLTNLELAKINRYLDANNAFRAAKAQDPGLGAQIGGILDAGASFAAGGFGGTGGGFDLSRAFQSAFNPGFETQQFFNSFLGGGNTGTGNFNIQPFNINSNPFGNIDASQFIRPEFEAVFTN